MTTEAEPDYDSTSARVELCTACSRRIYAESPNAYGNNPVIALAQNGERVKAHRRCTFTCENCNEYRIHTSSMHDYGVRLINANYRYVCGICWDDPDLPYARADWQDCDRCDMVISSELQNSAINDDLLCDNCINNEIHCDDCDTWYEDSDDHDCRPFINARSRLVHSYGYKPDPLFFGNSPYYLGLELELECKSADWETAATTARDMIGERAYLKGDGSLDNGFEIVSHPHSLNQFQNDFPWEVLDKLQELGCRSWNTKTCGIHVHVGRSAFNAATNEQRDTHQIKFIKLIYDNKDYVQRFAGRKSSWAKFDDQGNIVRKVKLGYQSAARYSAVNVENPMTLEVRVFRGTLRKERVLANIEFVHAAVEYTRNLKIVPKDNPFSWTSFIGYVSLNKDKYPNFLQLVSDILSKSTASISRQEELV